MDNKKDYERIFSGNYYFWLREIVRGAFGFEYLLKSELEKKVYENGRK